jgi:hypothetical protein
MEDISSLTHALHDLALSTASITSSGIPLAAALPILSPAGPPAVSPDAPPLILQAAPPSSVALQNHKREMQQILQESLQMLEDEDGAKQLSLMLRQKAALARILQTTTVAAKLVHELGVVPRECTRGHGVMHHAAPYGFVGTRSCTVLSDVCNSIIVSTLLL